MDVKKRNHFPYYDERRDSIISKQDKFELVSCSVKEGHCKKILPEINDLYAESELARINKEYLKSAELLKNAYNKTLGLKESLCTKCVELFQSSITETLETMQEEVHQMSLGYFHKKRYENVYIRLSNLVKKMSLFNLGKAGLFSITKSAPARADF